MKIRLTSIFVNDQTQALKFYTDALGFVKKQDFPIGAFKWLTVVSPDEPEGTELLLEPNDNSAAKTYQKAMFEQGIPLASFATDDIRMEFERLSKLGVAFRMEPTQMGDKTVAMFEDTCGNFVQLYQN